jgi:hypothetical protein
MDTIPVKNRYKNGGECRENPPENRSPDKTANFAAKAVCENRGQSDPKTTDNK